MNSPPEEVMASKTTGSMPVRFMTEPTVIPLVLFFRAHVGAGGKVELVRVKAV